MTVSTAQARSGSVPLVGALALLVLLLAIAMYAAAAGTLAGALTALCVAALPALLVFTWARPLIFPYCAYVLLVPFDLLLSVPAVGTAARLSGAAAGAALLFWLIRRRAIVVPGPALLAWTGFVAWSCLSMLWAIDPSSSARETGTLAQLVALYAIVSFVPASMQDVRVVVAAVAAGGIVAASFGIHELAHLSPAQQLLNEVSDRIPLLVGSRRLDINQFADSLLPSMSLVTVGTLRTRNLALKLLGLAAIAVLLYAISLAASREVFIAVAFMLGYFIVALPERRQLGALAVGLAAAAFANANLMHRFAAASVTGGSGRLSIWKTGLAAFGRHWATGSGSGSFASAYDTVYLKVFQPNDMGWARAAHNMLIQNGVEYGLIGVALLVGAVFFTVRSLPRLTPNSPYFGLRAGVIGALLGLCVAGFFVDLTTAKTFWLVLMLAALLRGGLAASSRGRIAT